MKKLTQKQVDEKLVHFPEWTTNKNRTHIQRIYPSSSYIDSLAHSARIAVYAEVFQHHPTIEFTYGKLKITLTSHDVKGITTADFKMAKKIDKIFAEK